VAVVVASTSTSDGRRAGSIPDPPLGYTRT
jgi:hypothetical protein